MIITEEIERWSIIYRAGHAYNSSPRLPAAFAVINLLIMLIQVYPIYNGMAIAVGDEDSLFRNCIKKLQDFFVLVDYIPSKPKAILCFCLALSSIVILTTLFLIRGAFLMPAVSYAARFIVEICLNLHFCSSMGIMENEIENYIKYGDNTLQLTLSVISSAILFFLLVFKEFITCKPLFIPCAPIGKWNYGTAIESATIIMTFYQLKIITVKNEEVGIYVYCCSFICLAIFFLWRYNSDPFFKDAGSYVIYLFLITCIFQNIIQMLLYNFQEEMSEYLTFIDLVSFFIAIPISSICVQKVYQPNDGVSVQDSDFTELENFDKETDFLPEEANSKDAIYRLHNMARYNMPKAVSFAIFCADNTTNNDVRMECYRILAVMHQFTMKDAADCMALTARDVSFINRQLLCDLQFEAIALDPSDELISDCVTFLTDSLNQIRQTLFSIVEKISMDQPDEIEDCILKYRKQCISFEKKAKLIATYVPRSYRISSIINDYFQQISYDFKLSQAWSAQASNLTSDTDSAISMSTSDIGIEKEKSGKSYSGHYGEGIQTSQRYTMQTLIDTVHSVGIIASSIILVVLFVLMVFGCFYAFIPTNTSFVYDGTVIDLSDGLTHLLYEPLAAIFNISTNVLSSCYSNFSDYIDFNYTTPLQRRTDSLDSCINFVSKQIYEIDAQLDSSEESIAQWSHDSIGENNITTHFAEIIISSLSDWQQVTECSNKTSSYLNLIALNYNYTNYALHDIQNQLHDISHDSLDNFESRFFIYGSCLSVAIIALVALTYYYLFIVRKKERGYFWNSLLEINPKAISEIRTHLLHGESLIKESKSYESSTESDNILGSDEIDADTQATSSTSKYEHGYLPIKSNEEESEFESEHSNTKRCDGCCRWLVLALFIILPVIYIVMQFSFFVPFQSYTEMTTDFNKITSLYTSVAAGVQMFSTTCALSAIDEKVGAETNIRNISRSFINYIGSINNEEMVLEDMRKTYHHEVVKHIDFYENIFRKSRKLFQEITNNVEQCFKGVDFTSESGLTSITETLRLGFVNYTYYQDEIMQLYIDKIDEATKMISFSWNIFAYSMFAVSIVFIGLSLYKLVQYLMEFQGLKSIILALSSQNIVPINSLIGQFTKKNKQNDVFDSQKGLLSRSIIKQSMNAIFVVDSNCVIQDINSAACELLQLKKENIIQRVMRDIIHNPQDKSALEQQYVSLFDYLDYFNETTRQQPADQQPETEYSILVKCGDSEIKAVNCRVIPLNNINVWGDDMCFAFIMRDQTEFLKNENELKDAQAKIESLLSRVVPKVIAARLISKGGKQDQDITNRVDKATIIFIGLHGFVEWCTDRGHQEIMQFLDVIFSKFDKKIVKYQTLVKIKTINGVYMAAAGLFNEISERIPVHEAVEFCLACGKWIKKRNKNENKSLQLHIGVNYDGPIISGVLGKDKPLFDIWGDAVNVSSRLETSSIPDTIQMSADTYNALPKGEYDAKQRDGVFLKGKGYTTTYYIEIPDPK